MSGNFKRYLNMYEWETVLPGSGKMVKYKPITTGQIKRLLLYNEVDDENIIEAALDTLISECVITDGFSVGDLYLQDRFFLMVEIRNVTKGYKYTFPSKCLSCDSQTYQTVDLSKLVVKKLEKFDVIVPVVEAPKNKGKLELVEPKKTVVQSTGVTEEKKLPWNHIKINDNITISINLLTRKMQEYVGNLLKDRELTEYQKQIEMNIMGYAIAIENVITPDGVENGLTFEDKLFLIENLIPKEKEKIDEWYSAHEFGLEFKFKVKCIHCESETERVIPLDDFFY